MRYYMQLSFKEREALKMDISKYFGATGINIPKHEVSRLKRKYNVSDDAIKNAANRILSSLF
jgi:hypothetical protein